jgi:glycogen phosphorylase
MNKTQKVAYFSMEVGLTSKIPTYSGGLGVLAGDMLKAAADAHFPMVGVTLLTKHGYFFQEIVEGRQIEEPVAWSIDDFLKPIENKVQIKIAGETVTVGAWLCEIFGSDGYMVPLYFLHTDLPENCEKCRSITDFLYGDGHDYRLQQEIILGVGGVRMLRSLGYDNLERYHMNEGHSSFLALELDRKIKDTGEVKKECVFTTHTPVPAGHDKFDMKLVKEHLEENLFNAIPEHIAQQKELNMTELALDYSDYINGVAKKHTEVSKTIFPNYPIHSITNGVHTQTWVSRHLAHLYDRYVPSWRQDSTALKAVSKINPHEIWKAHFEAKKQIIDFANAYSNAGLDYDYFTIGWARRFTSYKRPEMLLSDIDRLIQIAENKGPIQIVYAGKAHPMDKAGKDLIQRTIEMSKKFEGKVKMVYMQNYDMYLSKFITSGVDVWLNTPIPPYEASGTSGMKAALNGVPQLSVLDGWWQEGCVEGETGWSFNKAEELYDLLDNTILPCFYSNRGEWEKIMQKTIMINGSYFNAQRMLEQYINEAYRISKD